MMRISVPALLIALGLVVAGSCGRAWADESDSCKAQDFFYPLPKVDIREATAFMSGVTYRNVSWGHGNQIEYATADGRVFLWYPGNRVILPGKWRLNEVHFSTGSCIRRKVMLCFQYGPNTYNPVTGSHGTLWECGEFSHFRQSRTEVVRGDPLGLARMRVPPFLLPKSDQSIAQVAAQLPH